MDADWYDRKEGVTYAGGVKAESVNFEDKEVRLEGGECLKYRTLLVATGSR